MCNPVLEKIEQVGIVPVLTFTDPAQAVPVCRAILEGGIAAVEIAFRTPVAAECIARVTRELPGLTVGAGTVLTRQNARAAKRAGAAFLVAPGMNPAVVGWARRHRVPMIPGVATPTEIEAALRQGLTLLKFFPAENAGGLGMLKDFAGPYTGVRFMCTGGIREENAADYLTKKNVYAVGGSWMATAALLQTAAQTGDYTPITRACARACAVRDAARG